MKRISFCGLVSVTAFALTGSPQQPAGTAQKKTIEKAPIAYTSPNSGKEMYMSYCAVCHGEKGKGDGPVASALKTPPPDLTMLAQNNNGKYPSDHVVHVLLFGVEAPAHGIKDMPIWGPLFGSLHGRSTDPMIRLRVANLTKYIQSLQSKETVRTH